MFEEGELICAWVGGFPALGNGTWGSASWKINGVSVTAGYVFRSFVLSFVRSFVCSLVLTGGAADPQPPRVGLGGSAPRRAKSIAISVKILDSTLDLH